MGPFSALLAICAGNSPVPVNSPHNGQWRGALMFSLICVRINGWVNYREAGDLIRHRGHYDVNVTKHIAWFGVRCLQTYSMYLIQVTCFDTFAVYLCNTEWMRIANTICTNTVCEVFKFFDTELVLLIPYTYICDEHGGVIHPVRFCGMWSFVLALFSMVV